MFADVIVLLPIDSILTYKIPENLQSKIAVGSRVIVPIRNAMEVGIVINVHNNYPESDIAKEIKDIIDAPDKETVINQEMIQLCKWISDYYICAPGLSLQMAIPGFLRSTGKIKYAINTDRQCNYLPGSLPYQILEVIKDRPLDLKELKKKFGNAEIENEIPLLLKDGIIKVIIEPIKIQEKIKKEIWVRLRKDKTVTQEDLLLWQKKAPQQVKTYLFLLHEGKEYPLSELIQMQEISRSIVSSLKRKGLIEFIEKSVLRIPRVYQYTESFENHQPIILNEEQQLCIKSISDAIHEQKFKTFLLFGVTGSGKTEVYLQAIQKAMECGQQSLLLVPEISLTPQTIARLYSRFKEQVAVLHSGLSEGERFDEWRRIKERKVNVVVGVRSAIFAPFQRLGLIIIDEEHEHTYKQGETPRYHARDVAVMRAQINSAVCVLGSATPSLESFMHASSAKYHLLQLTQRVASGSLPLIHIVDLRKETDKTSGEPVLSALLREKIDERLKRKEQTILLINRRGFSPISMCPSCGWIVLCPNCQTSLNYHRYDGTVRCHYCNYKQPRPVQCLECGQTPLVLIGTGTQRIEDMLIQNFPSASIARMDTDVTISKSRGYSVLKKFAEHKIDILIGTQMIAKGHDYPHVTLVGVLNADIGLSIPNFRSTEFVFQLLMQVAGRSGRRERTGEVVIQTFMPGHYVIKSIQNHDYKLFAEYELRNRKTVGYPPYNRMIQFGLESEDEKEVRDMVYNLVQYSKMNLNIQQNNCHILGPAPAIIRKVQGKYRWQFALLGKATKTINAIARDINNYFYTQKTSSKILLRIDVDPYDIY
ncbi:MAG: primosomal protein N' [Candidatus Hydrogenedens sp.]